MISRCDEELLAALSVSTRTRQQHLEWSTWIADRLTTNWQWNLLCSLLTNAQKLKWIPYKLRKWLNFLNFRTFWKFSMILYFTCQWKKC